MCKATGCRLSVFSHTIEKIQRIFRAAASNIYHQQRSAAIRGDIASYALEHGLSEHELIELGASVPDDLAKLGFHIEDSPTLTIPLSVDECALEKALETEMNKQTASARITDVNSLTAIYRLRDGFPKRYLEKCEAIFVTTNKAMADIATRFFQNHFKDEGQNNVVQLCMTDIVFSVQLMAKQALSIAQKIIKLQAGSLSQIRENEKTNVRLETQGEIEKLVGELERAQLEVEVKSENLSTMVEQI